ncbi:AraC family transcriptional regulator [Marinomonas rhizomae]|uniref:AraC family transcriptional regulator n=1 Tax=Marinomonas rhizomae TaxID=491948 RepID=A0A366JHE1_9GAMM|nr:AraC family transcriptional regulator [Marinomonas rhizomae]RBP85754.1 AraC family transcriptional regulator [Marinomonas rhizomae]RNF75625.1 AraC family transcriptional regulator [Marinomonas rhizomae]
MYLSNRAEILEQDARIFAHSVTQCELHHHDAHECLWVVKGRIRVQVMDEILLLQEGDVLFINKGLPHATQATEEDNLVLCLQHNFVGVALDTCPMKTWSAVQKNTLPTIKRLMAHLWWEQYYKADYWQQAQTSLLSQLGVLFARYFPSIKTMKADSLESTLLMNDLLSQITLRYQEHLSLSMLAEERGLSEAYLSRYFKAKVGETFLRYLTLYRLEKSLSDLAQKPKKSVSDIAFDHGFPSVKAFNMAFRREYDSTPTEFRLKRESISLVSVGQAYAGVDLVLLKQRIMPWLDRQFLYL